MAGALRPPYPPLFPSRADKPPKNYERAAYTKSPSRPRTKGANFRGTTLIRMRHRRCRPHSGRLLTKALAITGEPEGALPADAGSVSQLPGDVRRRALRGLAAGDPLLFSLNQVKLVAIRQDRYRLLLLIVVFTYSTWCAIAGKASDCHYTTRSDHRQPRVYSTFGASCNFLSKAYRFPTGVFQCFFEREQRCWDKLKCSGPIAPELKYARQPPNRLDSTPSP
jgi:hypothetical protein